MPITNTLSGQVSEQVQSYTELGDGLNYWNNGWVESQDIIELTPSGAEAVHGQMKATFNSDITSTGAITLTTPAGEVFQSHPLGLFYLDSASSKVARVAPVQSSQGTLYPPNVVVYSNVLSGLKADLMLVWAKNGYEQNLVLKQAPPSPESIGFSSKTTRLQLWSSMDQCPVPQRQRTMTLRTGLVDHILDFSECWFPVGSAFAVGTHLPQAGQAATIKVMDPSAPDSIPVAKSLVNVAGQTLLIEELNYNDLLTMWQALPQAAVLPVRPLAVELADRGRLLPELACKLQRSPIQVASGQYRANGVILDYVTLSGSAGSYTFSADTTYYIPTAFSVSSSATFANNACIKYADGAYFMLNEAGVTFPTTGLPVIFTSKDDNTYGMVIDTSTSEPGYAAAEAIWVYNRMHPTTVQNALFRWASRGIYYLSENNANQRPAVNNSLFQNCSAGIYYVIPGDTLYLSGDSYCNVVAPLTSTYPPQGTVSGAMTANCATPTQLALANASKITGVEGEPGIAVNPVNPLNLFMAANHYTTGPHDTVLGARSSDGGLTWTTVSTDFMNNSYADPSVAFDRFGNLFVCYLRYDGAGSSYTVVVLLSTDGGNNFQTLTTISDSGHGLDWPRITTGPGGAQAPSSVWVTFGDGSYIKATGAPVTGLGNVGPTWTSLAQIPNSYRYNMAAVEIGPTGQVAVVCQQNDPGSVNGPSSILLSVNPYGLSQNGFISSSTILTSQVGWATYFLANPNRPCGVEPGLAWDRTGGRYHGRLYMVYTDRPDTLSQNSDIYVIHSDNQGGSWSARLKVNDDPTLMSQFMPRIAVDQTSGKVAVSWYDCRADTANVATRFYAAVSSDGGQSFLPNVQLETGSSNATATSPQFGWDYFDYTGSTYYGGYFYSSWADNSNTTGDNPDFQQGNNEMDIYVAKIKY